MNILFHDTETSGMPAWREPDDVPGQPHVVEFAAILVDPAGKRLGQMSSLVKPDGWTIDPGAEAVHGISLERATAEGRPEPEVLAEFVALAEGAGKRVAHVVTFDFRIIRIALTRFMPDKVDWWGRMDAGCTARLSTDMVDLPPTDAMLATGRRGPKMPKLREAYRGVLGRELEAGHGALVDVEACLSIYGRLVGWKGY